VNVPATIAENTTWISGTVYLVTGQTTLNAGGTLTIEAGAVVKFQNSGSTRGKLLVNGVLLVQGTADAGVVFTSIHDDTYGGDTNNNGGGTWPNAGDWDGLAFGTTSGGSSLDYATVVYGGADGNVVVTGAAVNLRHGFIAYGSADGLRWLNGAAGEISDTAIQQNLSNGISLSAASSPAVTGNTLRDNRGYAVYMEANCFPAFGSNTVFGNGTNGAGVYGTRWARGHGTPTTACLTSPRPT
jgi:parallel beta-helix repeat protein